MCLVLHSWQMCPGADVQTPGLLSLVREEGLKLEKGEN